MTIYSGAGEAYACRRREISSSCFCCVLILLCFFCFWPFSQSSRIFNLLSIFHGASILRDRERKSPLVTLLLLFPLLSTSISKSTKEDSSRSSGVLLNKAEFRFFAMPFYSRSGSTPSPPEAYSLRNSSMARAPPPHAHHLDPPWLSSELLVCFWWLEALGPSVPAFSPVKTVTAHGKTLILLEVPFNGLGPHNQQQQQGPTFTLLLSILKSCGPTIRVLKPTYKVISKAHLPFVHNLNGGPTPLTAQPRPNYLILVARKIIRQRPFPYLPRVHEKKKSLSLSISMNTRRIKVVFDREIRQRKKDARPSFALLDRVQYPRISDFCERLIHLFDLSGVCPHGITLSINGDLILPSETSHILRETDIVRVGMTKESLPGIVPEAKIEHDLIEVNEESYEGQERV